MNIFKVLLLTVILCGIASAQTPTNSCTTGQFVSSQLANTGQTCSVPSSAFATVQVGTATALTYAGLITSNSVTPGSIGAAGCADVSYTFTGVVTGSTMGFPRLSTGTAVNGTNIEIVGYVVSAANTVLIRYCNASTLSTQTPTAGSLTAFFAW